MSYLLDTNVISEIVRPKPDPKVLHWFNNVPSEALFISVLTLGEIRKGVEKLADVARKEQLRLWLEYDLVIWYGERILEIDAAVADKWGVLQSVAKSTISAIDSLLAATALCHNLRMVTRNEKDFAFANLEVINPFH
jgi:predicted nucleic acid-binding protein